MENWLFKTRPKACSVANNWILCLEYCSFSKGQSFGFMWASKWMQTVSKDGVKFRQVWCYLAVTTLLCYTIHPPVFSQRSQTHMHTVFLPVLFLTQAGILEKRGRRGLMWDVFFIFFSMATSADWPNLSIRDCHIFTISHNELLLLLLKGVGFHF